MKGHLRDIQIQNPIGSLPNIINTNNSIIKNEFDNIFDASNNVLVKSLRIDNGYVRAHWGRFVNIEVDRINIKDVSSSLGDILENVDHNSLGKRFFDDFLPEERLEDKYYCHDINVIKGLPKTLAIINASIATLWKSLSIKTPNGGQYNDALTGTVLDASLKYSGPDWQIDPENPEYVYPVEDACIASTSIPYNDYVNLKAAKTGVEPEIVRSIEQTGTYKFEKKIDNEFVQVFHSDIVKRQYPISYYSMSFKDLEKKVKVKSDLWDIKNHKIYNYIDCISNYVKIDNSRPYSLSLSNVGTVITLLLDNTDDKKPFQIKLNGKTYEHLYVLPEDSRITRVKLICVGMTDDYGPEFEIYEYSGKINIAKD